MLRTSNSLENLYKIINNTDDPQEIVELESNKLIFNSLSSYARKMKNDGIEQKDMESLFHSVLSHFN